MNRHGREKAIRLSEELERLSLEVSLLKAKEDVSLDAFPYPLRNSVRAMEIGESSRCLKRCLDNLAEAVFILQDLSR